MSDNTPTSTEVVICGAGIAGVSSAFHLMRAGVTDVIVVDERPPLTLTSDKSTECYRDWWPTRPMVDLMSRSIDLLHQYADESGNRFSLSKRGYLYVTADTAELDAMARQAHAIAALGAGSIRTHDRSADAYEPASLDGYSSELTGVDLFRTGDVLRKAFDYVTEQAVGGVHVRRAGWLSAQQLGAWMVEEATANGVVFIQDRVVAVTHDESGVRAAEFATGHSIRTRTFINAAGPLIGEVGNLVGADVPVVSEIHQKVSLRDHRGAFPRQAPMVIWNDPQQLEWDSDVAAVLMESGYKSARGILPRFAHGRPEGGVDSPWVLGLWEWSTRTTTTPSWPIPEDPLYPELVTRGLSTMLPAMAVYADALPAHSVDGGYYTKAPDNRPLIGPLGPHGSYVCGALSGYGIMAACATGELIATYVTGGNLPTYAAACAIGRFDDPAYIASLASLDTGQI